MNKYKLVPVEPTEEMLNVKVSFPKAQGQCMSSMKANQYRAIYQAMLASCPDVSSEPVAYMCPNFKTLTYEQVTPRYLKLFTEPQPDRVAHLESMIITRDSNIQWLTENYERVGGENIELNGVITQFEAKLEVAREALRKIHNGVASHFDAQMIAVKTLKQIGGTE